MRASEGREEVEEECGGGADSIGFPSPSSPIVIDSMKAQLEFLGFSSSSEQCWPFIPR